MYGSVENLAAVWASLDRLCAGLADSDWELPTGCPGWTVKDHVSHLVDYEARALLTLRVMDSWSHEQDIRRAVGVPGHGDGAAVAEVVDYFTQFLPYVVGKRAAAQEDSKVAFRVGDLAPVAVEVTAGRGRIAADPGNATATLAMPAVTFAALIAGRSDAPGDARITGDRELGQRVLDSIGILP